ncbi:MAG TPA: DNA-binding protein [Verrucomicrobiae bacterium]|nr:DNA-binding protein [Verrucomicrobiae bacterium]
MNRSLNLITVVALSGLLDASVALAQRGGGWGRNAQYNRMYDPKTVETLSGEVLSVETFTPNKGMSAGVHLQLKTDKEIVSVHLGPAWFIENQDVKIEPKDRIEVKGSRVTFDGKPAVIAGEVKKGDEVLKLRDDNGVPVWAGWRRR